MGDRIVFTVLPVHGDNDPHEVLRTEALSTLAAQPLNVTANGFAGAIDFMVDDSDLMDLPFPLGDMWLLDETSQLNLGLPSPDLTLSDPAAPVQMETAVITPDTTKPFQPNSTMSPIRAVNSLVGRNAASPNVDNLDALETLDTICSDHNVLEIVRQNTQNDSIQIQVSAAIPSSKVRKAGDRASMWNMPESSYRILPTVTRRGLRTAATVDSDKEKATLGTQPWRYATTQDWEAKKLAIKSLYIDYKLGLADVMRLMEERHGFCATVHMYKKQFAKWKWRKYGSRTAPCSRAGNDNQGPIYRSSVRGAVSRTLALHYESQGSRVLEDAICAMRTYGEGYVEKCLPGQQPSTFVGFDWGGQYTSSSNSASLITVLKRKTRRRILRHAVLGVESILDRQDLRLYIDVLVATIKRYILYNYLDMLGQFLAQASSLAARRLGTHHPISRMSALLLDLFRSHREQLVRFILIAYEFYVDSLSLSLGHGHRTALAAKAEFLRTQSSFDIDSSSSTWKTDRLTAQYHGLIDGLEAGGNGDDDNALILADNALDMEWRLITHVADFVERSEQLLLSIARKYGPNQDPGSGWTQAHIELYSNCIERLISYHLHSGQIDAAAQLVQRACFSADPKAVNRWAMSETPLLLGTEGFLRATGRVREADQAERLWRQLAQFRRVQQVDETSSGIRSDSQ